MTSDYNVNMDFNPNQCEKNRKLEKWVKETSSEKRKNKNGSRTYENMLKLISKGREAN